VTILPIPKQSEQRSFERWLNANAVLSGIMAAGIFALALMGGIGMGASGPGKSKTHNIENTGVGTGAPSATKTLPIQFIVPVLDKR
jgi:hypothetical protein